MKKLQLLLLYTCCASVLAANAQTQDKRWNIGLHGGATTYHGDLGRSYFDFDQAFYGFGGVSVSRYLGKHFDLNLIGTMGESGFIKNSDENFRVKMNTAALNLRFNLTNSDAHVRPFVYAGGGTLMWDRSDWVIKSDVTVKRTDAVFTFGLGLNFHLGETVNLQLMEAGMFTDKDDIDRDVQKNNDDFLMHTVGLTFNFGKKKDADGDHVVDRKDKCPDTPAGVAVDKSGCPLDRDKDGVADYLDECPDVAGTSQTKGCPDKDGDAIADKDDRCPDVSGPSALKGCPDADLDGVPDIDDKCASTTAGYKVDAAGCPLDNDKDGVVNEEDQCPDSSGTAALHGCPDTDGDGVADKDDHCPNAPGLLANKGCPEIAKEDVKKITQIASKIYFETNSDKIKTTSKIRLDELIDLLKKYDSANLSIEGHTDDKGDDKFNLTLSQKRADAVKKYLLGKGIAESRLTAIGYGETKPIADNKTSMGRTKNRRVELHAAY